MSRNNNFDRKFQAICKNIWNRSWDSNYSNKKFRKYVRNELEKVFGEHEMKSLPKPNKSNKLEQL